MDLESYPHIILTSPHQWNPQHVLFPQVSHSEQDEVEMRSLKATQRVSDYSTSEYYSDKLGCSEPEYTDESTLDHDIIMNVGDIS